MPTSKLRVGMPLGELVDPGARWHRRGDRHDAVIAVGQVSQRLAEHVLVLRRSRRGLDLRAGHHIELGHPVILVGRRLGRRVAVPLLGDDMDQARALCHIAHVLQHRDQRIKIVAIDRPDIIEPQFLEQGAAHRHAAGIFVGLVRRLVQRIGQLARQPPRQIAQGQERPRGDQPRQVGRKTAHRRRNRHVVVVEDHHQPVARGTRVVHRLIGHARRHRPVADHRNPAPRLARQLVGHRKTQRRGNRGGTVRRAERIVLALAALGETRKPARLPQSADLPAPPGQNLVRIGLMPDIPHQLVHRRVEHIMHRNRQLNHTQTSTQMPARRRYRRDHLHTQLVRKLAKLRGFQAAQVGRGRYCVEKWGHAIRSL